MARALKKRVRVPRPRTSSRNAAPMDTGEAVAAADAAAPPRSQVWRPGVDGINDDEELEYDRTAYDCLHPFRLVWPCLSFDIIRDTLGASRHEFPHTMFCVAGTQADASSNNAIVVAKLSNLTGKKRAPVVSRNEDDDSESSDSDESDDEEGVESSGPKLEERSIPHKGGINRIRAMEQEPHIVAAWSDAGCVEVWDVSAHLNSLVSGEALPAGTDIHPQVLSEHKDEGFALDWSPKTVGRLASGDWKSVIHLWEPTPGGKWTGVKFPYGGHKGSVEDLQWSPSEADVLASCGVDGTIAIWDVRARRQAISVKAHSTDVNVISWNRVADCMLASGSDDGTFRVWDLRNFKPDSVVVHIKYHSSAITSIEWSPRDSSQLAVTSEDHQLTIWDLSLERDKEEEAQFEAELGQAQAEAPADIPPQFLFSHQGQKDMKELHWHPQIPGLLVSTAGDGFNVFKPSNILA